MGIDQAGSVVLAIDGNSLLHRSFHALAGTGARSVLGEPIWAIRGLLTQLVAAADRVLPSRIIVGFDDPEHSVRRQRWPHYKAQRADKLPTLTRQLQMAAEVLSDLGVQVVVPSGLEADDVLASTARAAATHGARTIVVTSDRDAFALIDAHTSVLRVIDGGVENSPLLNPDRLELMLGIRPEQYRDYAALRGDASDNLPGVDGIGPKRAAALLREFDTGEAIFADAPAGGERIASILGPRCTAGLIAPEARRRWELNVAVMTFRSDLEVSCAAGHGPGRLPLSVDVVNRVLLGHGLPGTARLARRVLAQAPDADPEPPIVDHLGWDRTALWRGEGVRPSRGLPRLPVDPQPTLF